MRHQHIKTGGFYELIAEGKIQTDIPLTDYHEVIIYRSEIDNSFWVRPKTEFQQRFINVDPRAPRTYPIDTAPKDCKFLAPYDDDWIVVERFISPTVSNNAVIDRSTGKWWSPDKWMPLPD